MTKLLRYLLRKAFRQGVLGGESTWLVVGGGALALQLALRVLQRRPEVVFSEKLRPGERLVVSHRQLSRGRSSRESPTAQP